MLKRNLCITFTILLFILFLTFPVSVFEGTSTGIALWFNKILPTLFPFFIISGMLTRTGAASFISGCFAPLVCRIFSINSQGGYAILCGFLCGYPVGSKVVADLRKERLITREEGAYLLSFCNNTSPMYILNYLVLQIFQDSSLLVPTILILSGTPVFCSFIFRRFYTLEKYKTKAPDCSSTKPTCNYSLLLDSTIKDSMENIAKIGGYIVVFSILNQILMDLFFPSSIGTTIFLASLEMTTGTELIYAAINSFELRYVLLLFLTSFGGWCCAAQTSSMIRETELRIFPYIVQKLITASVTSFFAFLYLQFRNIL